MDASEIESGAPGGMQEMSRVSFIIVNKNKQNVRSLNTFTVPTMFLEYLEITFTINELIYK
jgi:hypothetical protein